METATKGNLQRFSEKNFVTPSGDKAHYNHLCDHSVSHRCHVHFIGPADDDLMMSFKETLTREQNWLSRRWGR